MFERFKFWKIKKGQIEAHILDLSSGNPIEDRVKARIAKNQKGSYDIVFKKNYELLSLPKKDFFTGLTTSKKRFIKFVTYDGKTLQFVKTTWNKGRKEFFEKTIPEEDSYWANQKVQEIWTRLDFRKNWEKYLPYMLIMMSIVMNVTGVIINIILLTDSIERFATLVAAGLQHEHIIYLDYSQIIGNLTKKPY